MTYKLCTAEKNSVAKEIARIVGANERHNGYYQGNGYIVTWAVGHLVGLAEPEEYGFVSQRDMYSDEDAKRRAYAELPLLPDKFKLIVLEETKAQFEIVKSLMHRPDVTEIIDCGDMGPEGHILQWFIRQKAGCNKPVKRFCATSMTDEALRYAMDHLRDEHEFLPVIRGELCKKKEDWILGMSLSRALSIKYHAGINVGRVQTPTLGFVVSRYIEVMNFKVQNYYTMSASMAGGFRVFWSKDTTGAFSPKLKMTDGRVLDRSAVAVKCAEIKGLGQGTITGLEKSKKATDRPQLYDSIELQRDANRKFGYTAAVTLATHQAMYETRLALLSYPRTDSRYITSDMKPYMEERVRMIGTIDKYRAVADGIIEAGLNIDKKIVNDAEVTDHHAIIPTENIKNFDYARLVPTDEEKRKGVTAETMRNILDLVLTRTLVAFSAPYRYDKTDVEVTFPNGMKFTASGQKVASMGWKGVQAALGGHQQEENDGAENAEQTFPDLQVGQTVAVTDCQVVEKKTTPPKLHTEDTLLAAMMNAGQHIENGAILKGRGIGTQATRGETIKKLYDDGMIETVQKGKVPYIAPTRKGMNVIKVLPPELYSPKITADWETKIAEIVAGTETETHLMQEFESYIRAKTEQVKNMTVEGVSFALEKKPVGMCPWCKADVYRYEEKNEKGKVTERRYYCSEKCDWSMKDTDMTFTTRLGRKITDKEALRFIAKKFIVLDCKSQKNGSVYRGEFTFLARVSNGKRYCNIRCEPVKAKK